MLPLAGDLREGGTFRLEGNAPGSPRSGLNPAAPAAEGGSRRATERAGIGLE
jgi:hypothetical protein